MLKICFTFLFEVVLVTKNWTVERSLISVFFLFCGVQSPYRGKRKLFSPHGSPINTSKFTSFYYSDALHPVIAVFSYCFWNHRSQTKANTSSTPGIEGEEGEGQVRDSAPPVNSSEFLVLLSFTSQMSANWVKKLVGDKELSLLWWWRGRALFRSYDWEVGKTTSNFRERTLEVHEWS